jgi:hypothetical protein
VIIKHLANLPSACPSDSSSLESCISALKSSISALETSVKTTEWSSGHWETVGWLCAVAVGIGIAGEIVVIVSEHLEGLEDWGRGIIRPPDRPPAWRFWFDIVATLVVLGGVFGEAGATAEVASINSLLRSKTSELRAKSDRLLAVITEEAGDAATSAHKAETSSFNAKSDAHAAHVLAGKTQAKANKAADAATLADSEARNAQQYATGIRTELESFKLEASAIMSRHTFRRGNLDWAKHLGPIDAEIAALDRARPETKAFAENLEQVLESWKWRIFHIRMSDGERGVVIYNKWVSHAAIESPHSALGTTYEIDPDMPAINLKALSGDKLSSREAEILSTLSAALDAKLQKDPELPDSRIRILIGDP